MYPKITKPALRDIIDYWQERAPFPDDVEQLLTALNDAYGEIEKLREDVEILVKWVKEKETK